MLNIIVCVSACALMIACVLFFPEIRIGKLKIGTYWIAAAAGAITVLACGQCDLAAVGSALVADTAVNPVKILALFLSMTVLSVFLDELGFFRALAGFALRHTGKGQKKLFFSLYITVSVLTVFTSNDVIVLSFTPFICYFAKEAKIDPMPYLAAEFVAANTWSMALMIGNPTNIYLASAFGIDFVKYFCVSILPTLAAGVVSLALLFLLFRKKLATPIEGQAERCRVEDGVAMWIGVIHLGACTLLLAVSSYIGVEMWIVSLSAVGSLFLCNLVLAAFRKKPPKELGGCIRRAPWQLVPFLLSMFIMSEVLSGQGTCAAIGEWLGADFAVWKYGTLSFVFSNLINNIPMSVFFSSVIASSGAGAEAVFATAVGSNLGAFFTPVGALAGIMFGAILSEHGIKFGFLQFLKLGICIAVPALCAALGTLLWTVSFA